jgi:hypothetical protein
VQNLDGAHNARLGFQFMKEAQRNPELMKDVLQVSKMDVRFHVSAQMSMSIPMHFVCGNPLEFCMPSRNGTSFS